MQEGWLQTLNGVVERIRPLIDNGNQPGSTEVQHLQSFLTQNRQEILASMEEVQRVVETKKPLSGHNITEPLEEVSRTHMSTKESMAEMIGVPPFPQCVTRHATP